MARGAWIQNTGFSRFSRQDLLCSGVSYQVISPAQNAFWSKADFLQVDFVDPLETIAQPLATLDVGINPEWTGYFKASVYLTTGSTWTPPDGVTSIDLVE